ncbi:Fibronectin type III domain-containing protein 7 [Liparis tanakae]|uniref:Fibronectin type III domain-containing protein 7 n=1 Tax=Liparis tanakae TaxID=230148 RepID=A0A4Z2HPN5_9TELE|nr:Fibronectin type III domain-containing protein 7 [Liparis tanakae]
MTAELMDIISHFMQKMLRSIMEAQDQLEREYLSKKEQHRAMEMQHYMGRSRRTGIFDPNRGSAGSLGGQDIQTTQAGEERSSVSLEVIDHSSILADLSRSSSSSRQREWTRDSCSHSTPDSVLDPVGAYITLSVFTVSSKSITVQWSGYADASSYKITATPRNAPGRPVFAQFSGDSVMGSVISLSPNTVYSLQLEAMDNALNVLSSAETEETTAPDVSSIGKAYSKHSDSVTVEFMEVSGATSYILRAQAGDFFSETAVSSSPGTVVQLQPYTDYKLSVMSVNAGGRSQPSYPIEARTGVMAPKLNTTSPANNSILVTWPPVENAVLYMLCIIRSGSSSRVKLNTTDTEVAFDGLEPGTTYCIKGTAWDPEGRAGDDLTVCQITRPPSPDVTFVQVTVGRSIGIAVYWALVQGGENYMAWTTNGQNCTATVHSYCYIIPVECGQNHSVAVVAYNSAGASDPSQPAEYITFPCCPQDVAIKLVSTETLEVMWPPVRGAELYETTAAQTNDVIHCNDTAPVCALSDLRCNTAYSVTVTPCSELRGCNRTCVPHTHETGIHGTVEILERPLTT